MLKMKTHQFIGGMRNFIKTEKYINNTMLPPIYSKWNEP